jgi:hypothetical protein
MSDFFLQIIKYSLGFLCLGIFIRILFDYSSHFSFSAKRKGPAQEELEELIEKKRRQFLGRSPSPQSSLHSFQAPKMPSLPSIVIAPHFFNQSDAHGKIYLEELGVEITQHPGRHVSDLFKDFEAVIPLHMPPVLQKLILKQTQNILADDSFWPKQISLRKLSTGQVKALILKSFFFHLIFLSENNIPQAKAFLELLVRFWGLTEVGQILKTPSKDIRPLLFSLENLPSFVEKMHKESLKWHYFFPLSPSEAQLSRDQAINLLQVDLKWDKKKLEKALKKKLAEYHPDRHQSQATSPRDHHILQENFLTLLKARDLILKDL